ncbi:MAG TPA: RHS repeat-associated core domain-containing protein, partial [Solirubrobacterales bacterium]|nr:RHS repeat-associated core domain-containing protein [Solirubrobacterales bacterium]
VESRQEFDPWGVQLSGPAQEMGYLGAYERRADPASALIQMGARAYDPALGSFDSEDPVLGHTGNALSFDRHLYVWDNPLNRYDLNGRDVCVLGACAGEAANAVAELPEELEGGVHYAEEGINGMASATASAAKDGWNATAPGRAWIAARGRDFWKGNGKILSSLYRFGGNNWERCREGARAGAPGGAVAGSVIGPEGTAPGAAAGGGLGCIGTSLVGSILEAIP